MALYNEAYLEKYVDLLVRVGVNIQPGQELLVTSPVDCAFFARKAVKAAYEAGASNVHLRWTDDFCARTYYLMADDKVFDSVPEWTSLMMNSLSERGCAFLHISASDPELLKGVDGGRISRTAKAANKAMKPFMERSMSNYVRWSVASIPTEAWAKKVFPDAKTTDEAIESLWREIFKACHIGEGDAVENWKNHVEAITRRVETLNKYAFKSLHMKNGAGTDLRIGLPDNHIWLGGQEKARDGTTFLANIPTEEIFTAPRRDKVDGTVVSTMPSVYRGDIIDKFSITFKDGKAVSYSAEKGQDRLESLIKDIPEMDMLGEIALVPHDSPISNRGILFYNTLYDENASCHLALGKAYPDCVSGGAAMTDDEKRAAGLNVSDDHHDFMFGSADMEITGTTCDGQEILVFKDGNFAF